MATRLQFIPPLSPRKQQPKETIRTYYFPISNTLFILLFNQKAFSKSIRHVVFNFNLFLKNQRTCLSLTANSLFLILNFFFYNSYFWFRGYQCDYKVKRLSTYAPVLCLRTRTCFNLGNDSLPWNGMTLSDDAFRNQPSVYMHLLFNEFSA